MKFLLIPDKFKGSLTAEEVTRNLDSGIRKAIPRAECIPVLASDGGDGFLDAVAKYQDCSRIVHQCEDPLGRNHKAAYLYNKDRKEAYIELAQASGMVLLKEVERSALDTSTFGTGLQIKHAIENGASHIFIGLGGSATNDGGTGIAQALGYRFLDRGGKTLRPTGANLEKIEAISTQGIPGGMRKVSFTAINDVNNPLYGPNGAAHVYAAQKGATSEEIQRLDRGLKHLDLKVSELLGKDLAGVPGSGAAGGTAYGLKVFLDAEFLNGIDFILQMAGIRAFLEDKSVDYIITGEGRLDRQTLSGKLIHGVMKMGKKYQIPVIAVCGKCDVPVEELKANGLHDVIVISEPEQPLEYNMSNAASLMQSSVTDYFK